jgi:hypothetical protein
MEETQMLVEGCNRVSALPSLSSSYCGVTRAHISALTARRGQLESDLK